MDSMHCGMRSNENGYPTWDFENILKKTLYMFLVEVWWKLVHFDPILYGYTM